VACSEVFVTRTHARASGCTVISQSHFIAVVGVFLIAVVVVGCKGVRSQAPQKEEQGHTQATKDQYGSEEARCSQTRTFREEGLHRVFTTNDVPGCPKSGLLSGTDKEERLYGMDGDDEIRGLGANDAIYGGGGNDIIYGGPGDDTLLSGDDGEDVLYGGEGNDNLLGAWDNHNPDKLDCGEGTDGYHADENDYVDSSCEKKVKLVMRID
jgi:hypothetical protein